MTRVEDLVNVLKEIKEMEEATDNDLKQIEISLLAHIAMALAEIADTLQADKKGARNERL